MSFLRPEAVATLRRWGESAAAGGSALLFAWWGVPDVLAGDIFGWFFLAIAVGSLIWLRAAAVRALAARPATGAGAAVIREGEIGYMGPWQGGFLDVDDIVRVEIYHVQGGSDPVWRLVGRYGQALSIPANAEGAGRLPEALTALPGFSDLSAVAAMQRGQPGRHVVWQRGA